MSVLRISDRSYPVPSVFLQMIYICSPLWLDRISVWLYTTLSLSASLMADSYGDFVTAPVTNVAVNIGV